LGLQRTASFAVGLALAIGVRVSAQQPTGIVRGTVRDSAGAAIVGAQVSTAGTTRTALTGDDGAFSLPSVPLGKIQLLVRRLGFRPTTIAAEVAIAPAPPMAITMSTLPDVLATVAVRARREPYENRLSGFNARRARGNGYFITREQIERTASADVIDALRGIAGVRVVSTRGLGRVVHLGGASCAPLVFLDGFPATAGPFDLDGIELGSLEGIEIYTGDMRVPPELMASARFEGCGVIALWTVPARPRVSAAEQNAVDVAQLLASGAVYTAEQVDTRAAYEDGSATALYPELLTQSHMRGRVVVQLVVDAEGVVEPGTVSVVTTTNDGFSVSAVAAALHARFTPAVFHGQHVRQLVLLPVEFEPLDTNAKL
jgi:TonB family protein